jgi:spermidine synthase
MGTFIVSLIIFPFGFMNKYYLDISIQPELLGHSEKRVAIREGLTETIQYFQKELLGQPHYYRLVTNSHSMSSTHVRSKRYMKLFVYWPIALNPKSQNALLICFGCGSTAKAMTDTQALKKIDIVDISKDIIEMSKIVFPEPKENPINDSRVRIHIEDGRFFLLSTKEKYDLITAEPPPPLLNGIVNLYSQEYFQLIHDRLTEGGIVTYWLPVYQLNVSETKSILKGFCNVFKDCSLWTGAGFEWMMVGIKNPQQTVSEKDFIRQWNDPQVGSEMRALGFESPEQFGSLFIADGSRLRDWISDGLPLVDNFPKRLSYQNKKLEELFTVYRNFMNENTSRENFMKSESISNIWPEKLKKESEKYFKVRQTINEILSDKSMSNAQPLENLNACLHEPLLENYIIWTFGSDQFAQKIILNRIKNISQNSIYTPEIYEHLVADAAGKRDYLLAEKYLHLATNNLRPPYNFENYFTHVGYRMYFLLRAGDKEGAVKVGQEYINLVETGKEKRMKQVKIYWNWLNQLLRSAS